ncbi:hypothetical protein C1645_811562 [Glomus cerebriforme]|uniref:Uncharacterized protein n=1 Tax=Glomus cerebriforme TaxID=658196 RepID=A0A397TQX1_9GLOM|nr:hypothetical protein C1645_811562 [Glomus cerebriforme]
MANRLKINLIIKKNYSPEITKHSQKECTNENNDNLSPSKWQKKAEALQELVCIRPDLKGKTLYFFPILDKYFEDILSSIQEKVLPGEELARTAVQKIIGGLEFNFFREGQRKKKLLILTRNNMHRYEVYVFDELVQEKYLSVPVKKMERTLDEIINFIRYIFAGFSKKLLKAIHASKEILIEKINQQRKVIKGQNELIIDLKKNLKEKIEKKEEEVLDNIANIIHTVAKDVINKSIDISTLHSIFQELICIQTGLLWDQRKNCYVGYLDFENEIQDY